MTAERTVSRADHEAFINSTHTLVSDLKILLEKITEASEVNAPKKRLSAPESVLLLKMLEAVQRFRTSQMEAIMAELEQYDYESGKELIAWLREQMDNLEYDAMRRRLNELAGSYLA